MNKRFHQLVEARVTGFMDLAIYYERCSSAHLAGHTESLTRSRPAQSALANVVQLPTRL